MSASLAFPATRERLTRLLAEARAELGQLAQARPILERDQRIHAVNALALGPTKYYEAAAGKVETLDERERCLRLAMEELQRLLGDS